MAAPSGTVWGSIYGNYGKLGLYVTTTSDSGHVYSTVQVWFWSKYSVSDSNNTLYYDDLSTSGSATTSKGSKTISTTVSSGDGWSTSNQVLLATYTATYARAKTVSIRNIYAALANVDRVGATMYVNTTLTIPMLPSYKVIYNANGGSGAPAIQTKWYGYVLTLSSTKPTRTGYTFQGWATSASGSVAYSAGSQYGVDATVTLYAVWKANTYTVSYNANGGSGAPSSQTKTHGVALTLSTTKPTRTNYTFKGWGTSPSSTTVSYAAGGSYTANSAITLYAVWEIAYIYPRITGCSVVRCDSSGNATEEGTYAKVMFNWATYYSVSSIKIKWKTSSDTSWTSTTVSASGTSGSVSKIVGSNAIDNELIYSFQITVADSRGSSTMKMTLDGILFPIDILEGGTGVAIGKSATVENAFDVYMQTIIRGNEDASGLSASGQLIIGDPDGAHIAMDNNEIMAKSDAKTPTNLSINYEGGNVGIGGGESNISLKGDVYVPNSKNIRSYDTDGNSLALAGVNGNNYSMFGYGGYSNGVGASYFDGNNVNIRSKGAVYITSPTAGISGREYGVNKLLWSGAWYMTADHSAGLSQLVSAQPHGIVLLFQYYRDGAVQGIYTPFFIPKYIIPSSGSRRFELVLSINQFAIVSTKTLFVYDSKIVGSDYNSVEGTGTYSGINFNNQYQVLTHVIGV